MATKDILTCAEVHDKLFSLHGSGLLGLSYQTAEKAMVATSVGVGDGIKQNKVKKSTIT